MTCTEIADLLPEYIRRRLPAEEAAAVRAHLSACPACAEAYEAELAFTQALRGTDAPPPAHLLPQIMASVRVQPQHKPTLRPQFLDLVAALVAGVALYGMIIGVRALWYVVPLVVDALDFRALLSGSMGVVLVLAAVFGFVGLAISLTVAALVQTTTGRMREPYAS